MMNKKLLKLTRKNITKLAVCVLLCCISTSCKSQINILSNEISNLKPSSQIKNNYLNEIFEILLNDESTINWKLRTKKMFLVSSLKKNNDTIVRIIPKVREKHSIGMLVLPNTYSAYLMYKDIFVVYWGDEKIFFEPTKSRFINDFFKIDEKNTEQNIFPKIDNDEFYGYEFLIKDNKIRLLKKDFFASPLIGNVPKVLF